MMTRKVRFRRSKRPPRLYEAVILAWAEAFYERFRRWPKQHDGLIIGTLNEKWLNVDMALRIGLRGLPGGSSLARLLAQRRGVRNHMALPLLSRLQILAWADAYYRRNGCWPDRNSGTIDEAAEETWMAINMALQQGHRGLPEGASLAQLFADERGVRNQATLSSLSLKRILTWADAHFRRTGKWPRRTSGPVVDAPGETWLAVQTALQKGQRGLPGGSSLAQLLAEHRGVRNHKCLPKLTEKQIVRWAKTYQRRSGKRPSRYSGPIEGSGGETWAAIDTALQKGQRGFPGGSSLPRLLSRHAKGRNRPLQQSSREQAR